MANSIQGTGLETSDCCIKRSTLSSPGLNFMASWFSPLKNLLSDSKIG